MGITYEIRGKYNRKFELVCSEDTRAEALKRLKEYQENEPYVAVKKPQAKPARYKIVRGFLNEEHARRTIKRGLTLDEAQAHCRNPESSWKTATSVSAKRRTQRKGPWFDGYTQE